MAYVDVAPRMVELARARGVDARRGDVQELPFADGGVRHCRGGVDALPRARPRRGLSPRSPRARRRRRADRGDRTRSATSQELRELLAYYAWHSRSRSARERRGASCVATSRTSSAYDARRTVTVRERAKLDAYRPRSRCRPTRCPDDVPAAVRRPRPQHRSSWRRRDPAGRADPAQARRRGAARRRARRARPRLRARRGARLPDGGVLHGRLLPRPLRARDVRADRRDDPQRRDARPRRRARPQGRRQALDRRGRRQDLARGRADRRGVRRARSGR